MRGQYLYNGGSVSEYFELCKYPFFYVFLLTGHFSIVEKGGIKWEDVAGKRLHECRNSGPKEWKDTGWQDLLSYRLTWELKVAAFWCKFEERIFDCWGVRTPVIHNISKCTRCGCKRVRSLFGRTPFFRYCPPISNTLRKMEMLFLDWFLCQTTGRW